MTNDGKPTATDLRDIETACHLAADAAEHVMRGDVSRPNVPTLLVVLAAAQNACRMAGNTLDLLAFEMEGRPEWEVARPKGNDAASHAPAGAKAKGEHRHKFDEPEPGVTPACTICGKLKSANGRKAAAQPAAPTAEERALALPMPPLGDVAADRFAGGAHGSSGVVRR